MSHRTQGLTLPAEALENHKAESDLRDGLHIYPKGTRLCLSDLRHGHLQQKESAK